MSHCIHVKIRWERVEFASFDSIILISDLSYFFSKNFRVLIERTSLRMNYKEEWRSSEALGAEGRGLEEGMVM